MSNDQTPVPASKSPAILSILRWIALIPAAILASALVEMGVWLTEGIMGSIFPFLKATSFEWSLIVAFGNAIGGYAFVVVAFVIAPAKKEQVAFAAVFAFLILDGIPNFLSGETGPIVNASIGVLGAAIAAWTLRIHGRHAWSGSTPIRRTVELRTVRPI